MLELPISELKGVGEKTEKKYQKLGVYTISDILLYFPKSYLRFPEMKSTISSCMNSDYDMFDSEEEKNPSVAILGMLRTPATMRQFNKNGRKMSLVLATVFTEDASFEAVWFNMPYMRNQIQTNLPYVFYGKLLQDGKHFKMEQPEIFVPEVYEKKQRSLRPRYVLTKGLSNNAIEKAIDTAFSEVSEIPDYLPEYFLQKRDLISLRRALRTIHHPDSFEELRNARRRLAYDEFFQFLLELKMYEEENPLPNNSWTISSDCYFKQSMAKLPFSLTKGQEEVLSSYIDDFKSPHVCQGLLQGDVGSGKTIIAFLLMTLMVEQGYQAAIMAPTEVLATQHFKTFLQYIEDFQLPFDAVLLTGSMSAKEKREAYFRIANEESLYIIGTHALIQEKVNYHNLSLVITDEQHRFGVKQRKMFSDKGMTPHSIVMSATPIPRTLALILYGDMKLSVISDVPARRLPIKNALIKKNKRITAYQFIGKEIKAGHQAYVICPLVDASDKSEAENVVEYKDKIQEFFGQSVRVGLMHGKLKPTDKQEVMDLFLAGEIDILVSTTVIEVGINVPNATVILIEDANRFGLAQLHQLRGRVGRGEDQSYCILIDSSDGEEVSKRLQVLSSSNDGFYLASEDLKLRGPGDFYGVRQSGDFGFALADVFSDSKEMQEAACDAEYFLTHIEEFTANERELVLSSMNNQSTFYSNL